MRPHDVLAWAVETFDSSKIPRTASPIDRYVHSVR
jgi:hypothetical protein